MDPRKNKKRNKRKAGDLEEAIVRKAYEKLYEESLRVFKVSPFLSKKYVELIFKLRRKTKVDIPKRIKRFICRKCFNPLIPGKTLEVRVNSNLKVVEYKCLVCGFVRRYKYK
jgi:ribonuclease P protein subunit RPR2